MKEKQRYHIGIGVPSILMIFVVLCLTTFGVLSYSSASADYRLTEKNIVYMKEYYQADAKAQETLRMVDRILQEKKTAGIENYKGEILSAIDSIDADITALISEDNNIHISFQIPVEGEKYLSVVLMVLPFQQAERYIIEEYCLTQKEEGTAGGIIIEETESIGLWQGGK